MFSSAIRYGASRSSRQPSSEPSSMLPPTGRSGPTALRLSPPSGRSVPPCGARVHRGAMFRRHRAASSEHPPTHARARARLQPAACAPAGPRAAPATRPFEVVVVAAAEAEAALRSFSLTAPHASRRGGGWAGPRRNSRGSEGVGGRGGGGGGGFRAGSRGRVPRSTAARRPLVFIKTAAACFCQNSRPRATRGLGLGGGALQSSRTRPAPRRHPGTLCTLPRTARAVLSCARLVLCQGGAICTVCSCLLAVAVACAPTHDLAPPGGHACVVPWRVACARARARRRLSLLLAAAVCFRDRPVAVAVS